MGPRNYVVMEVKSNLLKAEREENLKRFPADKFKRSAYVVMGEPKKDFRDKQLELVLKDKQEKAEAEWNIKRAEKERKKVQEARAKQVMELRRQADERRKKAAEEAKKKAEEKRKSIEDMKKAREE